MAREIDSMKHWTNVRLEVAREIDSMKRWTDGGLEVAREIDSMKHWTNVRLEVAREIDSMKRWTDGGLEVAREIPRTRHWSNWGCGYTWRTINILRVNRAFYLVLRTFLKSHKTDRPCRRNCIKFGHI